MKGIVSVVGKDKVGIIAAVCTYLSTQGVNILDISQTIVQDNFNMMMIVDLAHTKADFDTIIDGLEVLGAKIGVSIKLQHEAIFESMHRI